MIEGRKIAIIVKGSDRIGEVPEIMQGCKGIYQYIQVFLICNETQGDGGILNAAVNGLSDCGAVCFADDPESARKFGFRYATIEEMAPVLRMFDAVIPI